MAPREIWNWENYHASENATENLSWTRNAEFEFDKKESEKIDLGVNKTGIKPREKKKKSCRKEVINLYHMAQWARFI